jgi:phosphohistidine phosphatase SixA
MRLVRNVLIALVGITAMAAAAAPADYYVMRHLQKGGGDDPALSDEGQKGAERLATWFRGSKPSSIYVSATRRARQTAAPLATKLGLTAKEYDPGNTPGLIARVKAETGTVLIVGHSNTVPDIVAGLGGKRPAALAETDFGAIWHVGPGGKTEKKKLAK